MRTVSAEPNSRVGCIPDAPFSSQAAFGSGFIDDWSYNDRNELLGTDRKSGTSSTTINTTDTFDTAAAVADRRFTYDTIGNRTTSDIGEAIEDPNQPTWTYDRNSLNQYYTVVTTAPFMRQYIEHDEDGNRSMQFAWGDVNGDGGVDVTDLSMLLSNLGDTCESHDGLSPEEFGRADVNGDCVLSLGDLSGLLSGFGVAPASGNFVKFTWDAENRLIEVEPLPRSETNVTIPAGYRRLKFAYDYRGRRVEKLVFKRDASNNAAWGANPIERRRFVWNGWLMLRETIETDSAADGTFESTRTKTYSWGRDLGSAGVPAGNSLESAGGIGGLLALSDDAATAGTTSDDLNYVYFYDANGNVGQISNLTTNASASLVAKYEYDAYGNVAASSGTYANANAYRFSTKPGDDETGLGYWGYRYYEPRLGRWLNRDPAAQSFDSQNETDYGYCINAPSEQYDYLGLLTSIRFRPDIVEIWCTSASGPDGTDSVESSSSGNHCYILCKSQFGKSLRAEGTGPGTPDNAGNPGGNGNPGYDGRNPRRNGTLVSTTPAPAGTCACIAAAGNKLNSITGKSYQYVASNSNSATCILLRACGVTVPTPPGALGWCGPVFALKYFPVPASLGGCRDALVCPVRNSLGEECYTGLSPIAPEDLR